jgi:hypothetical protein
MGVGVGTAARLVVAARPVTGVDVAAAATGAVPALVGGLAWASAQKAPSAVMLAMTVASLAVMFFLNFTMILQGHDRLSRRRLVFRKQ